MQYTTFSFSLWQIAISLIALIAHDLTSCVHVVGAFRVGGLLSRSLSRHSRSGLSMSRNILEKVDKGTLPTSAVAVSKSLTQIIFPFEPSEESIDAYDWSFLDDIYLITCPNADPGSQRLNKAMAELGEIGLLDKVKVKEFATDDDDRIRGCYTSHISVLKDAVDCFAKRNGTGKGEWWQHLLSPAGSTSTSLDEISGTVLVLEDNLELTGELQQSIIDAISSFARNKKKWDMIHLSYIPYVPNLVVSKTEDDAIVKLTCGVGSALGTTAYIINLSAMKALLEEDKKRGYYAPIPDVMANLFPNTRYSSYPTPFVRAPQTKSLVNPQLDDLRVLMFQPAMVLQVQKVLAASELSTNALLPLAVVVLLVLSILAGRTTLGAAWSLATTGAYDGPILLPLVSTLFSVFSLGIVAFGAAIAPKPQLSDE